MGLINRIKQAKGRKFLTPAETPPWAGLLEEVEHEESRLEKKYGVEWVLRIDENLKESDTRLLAKGLKALLVEMKKLR